MNPTLLRVRLNARSAAVRRDLADAVRLHRRVMSLLPDNLGPQARASAGVLFRREEDGAGTALLIQTGLPTDPSRLPADYGEVAVKDLTPMLEALRSGLLVRYRVVANASKRVAKPVGTQRKGQVVPLVGNEALDWWRRRAASSGLTLRYADMLALDAARRPAAAETRLRHAMTRFDGIAAIADADAVRAAILAGVGKGKSYGCGLLSLAPAPAT